MAETGLRSSDRLEDKDKGIEDEKAKRKTGFKPWTKRLTTYFEVPGLLK